MAKRTVTGSQFALRHILSYDFNNNTGNEFEGSWDAILEGEFRHSLLRGGGVEFNRIAGPGQPARRVQRRADLRGCGPTSA